MSGRGVRPAPGRRNGREKLEGSTDAGGAASGGKRPSTIEQRSGASGPRAVARQKGVGKPIPVVEAPILVTAPETAGPPCVSSPATTTSAGCLNATATGPPDKPRRALSRARGTIAAVALLLVATTGNPGASTMRAEAVSQALGSTTGSLDTCRARSVDAFSRDGEASGYLRLRPRTRRADRSTAERGWR
jgi:hypothetical protein